MALPASVQLTSAAHVLSVTVWACICRVTLASVPNNVHWFPWTRPGYLTANNQVAHPYQMMHTRHFLTSLREVVHTPRPSAPAVALDEILALVISDNFPFYLTVTMCVCSLLSPASHRKSSADVRWPSDLSPATDALCNSTVSFVAFSYFSLCVSRSSLQTFIASVISTAHNEGNNETCDHDSPTKEKCLFFTREQLFL